MNLPPELRNRVYDVLINTGKLTKTHPNILAVNRQIHQEASPILYGNQQFEIHIHIDGVLVHGLRLGDKYMSLLELQWPSWLKYVRNLRIELHEPGDRIDDPEYRDKIKRLRKSWNVRKSNRAYSAPQPRSEDLLQMSQVLYSLCSFLQSSNKLNRLELALQHADEDGVGTINEKKNLWKIRFPLSLLLPSLDKFYVDGHAIMVHESRKRLSDRQSKLPRVSAFKMFDIATQQLEECNTVIAALRKAKPSDASLFKRKIAEDIKLHIDAMDKVFKVAKNVVIDGAWEKQFAKHAQLVERAYRDVQVNKI